MYIDFNIIILINIIFMILIFAVGGTLFYLSIKDFRNNNNRVEVKKFDYDLEAAKLKLPSTPIYLNDFDKLIAPVVFLIDQNIEIEFTKFKSEFGKKSISGSIEYYMSPERADKLVKQVCTNVRKALSDEFILSMNRFLSVEGFGGLVNEITIQKVFPKMKEMNTTVYDPQVKQSIAKGKEKRELKETSPDFINKIASLAGLTPEEIDNLESRDDLFKQAFKGLNTMR